MAMLQLKALTGLRWRVNVVKKVKVNGLWKFCSVVIESNGKLRDRVRINGHAEVHPEGVYFIEWRESGQRRRQAVQSRSEVLEQARLKAVELETAKTPSVLACSPASIPASHGMPQPALPIAVEGDKITSAASAILQGMEAYLQVVIGAAVQLQLGTLGLTNGIPVLPIAPSIGSIAPGAPCPLPSKIEPPIQTGPVQNDKVKKLIAEAVESFLKEIQPPRREPKTYSKYRLTLHIFRDTCKKEYLEDLSRSDCLAFMDHLYSIDNEARTVANRMTYRKSKRPVRPSGPTLRQKAERATNRHLPAWWLREDIAGTAKTRQSHILEQK